MGALGLLGSDALAPEAPTWPTRGSADDVERVQIKTEDRQTLVASLYTPSRRRSGLAPGAILIHDAGMDRTQLEALAERLQKQGFCVLVPDLRGHGESVTQELDYAQENVDGQERMWAFAGARDIEASAKYLQGLDGVHSTNLSLVGYRAGAVLAARYARDDQNVRDLIVIDPVIEKQEGEPDFVLTMKDLEELGGLPTFVVVPKEQQQGANRLVNAAMRASGGGEFIEIVVSKSKSAEILDDKRMPSVTSKWMMDQAFPKRGQ